MHDFDETRTRPRGSGAAPAPTSHHVMYYFEFCNDPLVEDCSCSLGDDHLGVYPVFDVIVVDPTKRLVRRLRAWWAQRSRERA